MKIIKIIKAILLLNAFVLLFLHNSTYGQESKLNLKIGLLQGIASSYQSLNFVSPSSFSEHTILYSGGGGFGVEAGIGYSFSKKVLAEASFVFQHAGGLQIESSTGGGSNRTIASFNKFNSYAGLKYRIPLNSTDNPTSLNFGAGAAYMATGLLNRIENSESLGYIVYTNAITYYISSEVQVPFSSKWSGAIGLRYRPAEFEATYYSDGPLKDLDPELRNFSGTGVDIYFCVYKRFK